MYVDQQTLRDLEVFESRDRRTCLFQYVDYARTIGGSQALRKRMSRPLSDIFAIQAVQNSLQQINDRREVFDRLPNQYLISGVNHYLAQSVTPPVEGSGRTLFFEGIQLWIAEYSQFSQLLKGVRQTVYFFKGLKAVVEATPPSGGGALSDYLDEARTILSDAALGDLPPGDPEKWHWWTLLRADQIFRREQSDLLKRALTLVFEVDALVAMADATKRHNLVIPRITTGDPFLFAEGLTHLPVPEAIANPVNVDQTGRLLFITGPNMAGKSTYLRAVGTALYLAHIGMGVPAASFAFAPFDSLYTALSVSDDVHNGISFFQAEARRARDIALAIARGERVAAIIDEPFKGTNVRDALDASIEFLTRLSLSRHCIFLASSHLVEVAELLKRVGQTRCVHFEARELADGLEFDYILKCGVSSQRLGLRVLEEHGVFRLLDTKQADDTKQIQPVSL